MSWEQISYNIEQFWNKPIPIIGFTVGAVIVGVLFILAKTSIGRKALNELKKKYNEIIDFKNSIEDKYNKLIEEKDKLIEEKGKIIEELQHQYDDKLALVQANKDKEKEIIIAIAENINNVKIKKIIEEYKKLPEITDISEVLEAKKEELEDNYKTKYEEILKKLEEIENGKDSEPVEEEIQSDTI